MPRDWGYRTRVGLETGQETSHTELFPSSRNQILLYLGQGLLVQSITIIGWCQANDCNSGSETLVEKTGAQELMNTPSRSRNSLDVVECGHAAVTLP